MPKARIPLKCLSDRRVMLNLACGTRMHWDWNNLDFSPYTTLAKHPVLAFCLTQLGLLSQQRSERLKQVDPRIISWDLRKGIPFPDETFDVIYHSHFLEHIDREHVQGLLEECRRALKSGGMIRVVVPDLEALINAYLITLRNLDKNPAVDVAPHKQSVGWLFDQMVRNEGTGSREQKPFIGWLERRIRGGAAETGELHRWMYDRHTLAAALAAAGFRGCRVQGASSSQITGWNEFCLDTNSDGSPYKPQSLYMEAVK